MIKFNFLFFFIFLFFSCSTKTSEELKTEKLHNILNADVEIKYYENGDLHYVQMLKNGIREGRSIFYYKNGEKNVCEYRNNKLYGNDSSFYSNGNKKWVDKVITYNNNVFLNEKIYYKENGEVIKDSSRYVSVSSVKDTFKLNENGSFTLKLEASGFSLFDQNKVIRKVVLGEFDNENNLLNPDEAEIFDLIGNSIILDFKAVRLGNNSVRGFVYERFSDGKVGMYMIYFTYEYYVHGKRSISVYDRRLLDIARSNTIEYALKNAGRDQ
jgi:hypothetical protein